MKRSQQLAALEEELLECQCELGALGAVAFKKSEDCLYTITICGNKIQVQEERAGYIKPKDFEKIFEMKAFADWCTNFDSQLFDKCTFTTIYIQHIDMFGPRVGFLKFKTDMKRKGSNKDVSSIVFMRGGAVAMLVILRCKETNVKYALVTVQTRVPAGKYAFAEIPAGMLDDSGDFAGVAAKEMKEETGLIVNTADLVDMIAAAGLEHTGGVYPSVGGCDEFLKFCLYEKVMSKEKIEELEGKCTGNIEEGEEIKLKIVPLNKLAETCPDMKTLTALYLYRRIQINRNREDIIREMEDETLRLKPLPNKL